MRTVIAILVICVIFIAALLFSSSNTEVVTINYFVAQGTFKISTLLGLAFFSGFVICWAAFAILYWGLKLKLRSLNKRLSQQQQANNQLQAKLTTDA